MRRFSAFALYILFAFSNQLNAQIPGDSLFLSPTVHTIKIFFSQTGWYDSLIAYKPLDKKMMGDVEIDGTYIDSVGIQFKGNSSFNAPGIKKPWKIDFNEYSVGTKYDGLKTINLNNVVNDPSFLREKVFDDFCRTVGIEAPRATYANVYVNNTLWGFYVLMEQCDKTMLDTQIGNNGGNLFKGDPNGTLQWFGSAASSYYSRYELKTNKTVNDWTGLVRLIDEINNTPSASFYDSLETILNTNSWIEGWAANNLFVNLDSYIGTGHNYYVYHNTATNKFDFIIWDANEAFGKFSFGMSVAQLESLSLSYSQNPVGTRPMTEKMLQNTTYMNAYVNTVCNYVVNYFSNAYFDPKIDSLVNIIRPHVYADPNKPMSNANFETNITSAVGTTPGIKSFIANRRTSLLSQLAAYGCFMGVGELQVADYMFQVHPNPNRGEFLVQSSQFPVQIQVISPLGQIIHQTTVNSNLETVNLGQAPGGIYFYCVLTPSPQGEGRGEVLGSGKLIIE